MPYCASNVREVKRIPFRVITVESPNMPVETFNLPKPLTEGFHVSVARYQVAQKKKKEEMVNIAKTGFKNLSGYLQ